MKKNRILTMFALLFMAAVGAWAEDTYTVTVKYKVSNTFDIWGEEKIFFDAETLPKETTLRAWYKAAWGYAPNGLVYTSADDTNINEFITLGEDNGWDTPLTITGVGEGVIHIEANNTWGDQRSVYMSISVVQNATKGEGNTWTYTQFDGDAEIVVEYLPKATLDPAPTAFGSLIYPNTDVELISRGSTSEGTIYYAMGSNGTTAPTEGWSSTDVPTAKNCLTDNQIVYVWYKVVADDTHNDIAPTPVAVAIGIPSLTLSEDVGITTEMNNIWKDKVVNISFTRTFDALTNDTSGKGKASTICLPFDFDIDNRYAGSFAVFMSVGYSGGEYNVTMQEMQNDWEMLSAGVPYMFIPSRACEVMFKNEIYCVPSDGFRPAGTQTDNGLTFTGTYTKRTWESGQTRLYGFAANDYKENGAQISANEIGEFRRYDYGYCEPFRSYLWASAPSGARAESGSPDTLPETIKVILLKADGTATNIGTLDTHTGEITLGDEWYDLGGHKFDSKPVKKGVYINNGKKITIE